MSSNKQRLQREVDDLRVRVESLMKSQQEAKREAPEPRPSEPQSSEPSGGGLEGKFEELFETLKGDLEEASAVTVLTVFALGLLVGRSLAF